MAAPSQLDTTRAEFDEMAASVCVWADGRDSIPLVRRITGEVTRSALAQVRTGEAIGLSRPLPTEAAVDNPNPADHHLTMNGALLAPGDVEPTAWKDYVGLDYHGKTASHIDAFSHIAYRGQYFGGVPADPTSGGVDVLAYGPLVTRGVLLDMPRLAGEPWTEPGTAWRLDDIRAALEATHITLQPGDCLLLRNGHDRRRRELGAWDADAAAAGLHVSTVPWLLEQGVSVFGADGETDVRPSPVEGVTLPVHVLCLVMAGVPLLDNLDLDTLAAMCAEQGRSTFALAVNPLNLPGGTGSPVNPIAIF